MSHREGILKRLLRGLVVAVSSAALLLASA